LRVTNAPLAYGSRMSGVQEAAELFKEAGLVLPPIPTRLAPEFRRIHNWCYATREINAFEMYMFGAYPHEVVAGPVDDYVAVSHAGHGINSYGLNYHLVYEWIAVFVQVGWGGVYHGSESVQRVGAWFSKCGDVLDAAARHNPRPQGRSGRLVVAQSDFRDVNVCEWLDAPLSEGEGALWIRERWRQRQERDHPSALDSALDWLTSRDRMPRQVATT
jgi:hypothetical protein